ncbi:hypothetical protein CDAR_192021 [Caerostris darwini]|uniref:Uncharacterized protein n=1 Tax=Caerostris darwini TaxID=1538125 RepID=A0AAV4NSE2_9ARAC|nr:hypothetical protein CDAR_192021 [Caerostris darwini]
MTQDLPFATIMYIQRTLKVHGLLLFTDCGDNGEMTLTVDTRPNTHTFATLHSHDQLLTQPSPNDENISCSDSPLEYSVSSQRKRF